MRVNTLESATDDKNKKKHPGGGRPLKFKDFDTQLAAWVRGRRSKKLKISRRTIQMKAQQMWITPKFPLNPSELSVVGPWTTLLWPRHSNRPNAVKIYDQNPEDNMQIEIQLPSNCKPGYFSVNLNRRFCPYRMMEVKSLQACCQGGEPRFQLEDMQRMAILNKDQLAIELNGLS
uniref:HTH CENPB-type domain-containing protein n=1 Tax=Ditylenchus dipsaci TaxID=166011 RepID=A0A915CZ58_9BILA